MLMSAGACGGQLERNTRDSQDASGDRPRPRGWPRTNFRTCDLEGLTKDLDPNPGWVIVSMVTVGKAPREATEATPRSCAPLPGHRRRGR